MPILVDVKARCDYCDRELIDEDVPLNQSHYPMWHGVSDKMSEHSWKMKLSTSKRNWDIHCDGCK